MGGETVTLFVCGDVMTGRGVDQILRHPGDPALREPYVDDARSYVELAEAANGPVPRPVDRYWPWGEALRVLEEAAPDVRVVNLETAVTVSDDFAAGKGVHYRMHPANLPCLTAARPDVCVLANNHVLDFGRRGLLETLDALAGAGLTTAGAGRDAEEAWRPAAVPVGEGQVGEGQVGEGQVGEGQVGEGSRRVVLLAVGMPSSGIPSSWAADARRPGVALVPEASRAAAAGIAERVREAARPGDVTVVSVHWGSNWGYDVPAGHVDFAHALIEGGVDLVHGHSSHHPRPLELYRGRPVLYGCGDFVDDYEGITGYEEFRDDLRLLYLVSLPVAGGGAAPAAGLRMVPLRARRMRLEPATAVDAAWLRRTLDRISRPFGVRVVAEGAGGALALA